MSWGELGSRRELESRQPTRCSGAMAVVLFGRQVESRRTFWAEVQVLEVRCRFARDADFKCQVEVLENVQGEKPDRKGFWSNSAHSQNVEVAVC